MLSIIVLTLAQAGDLEDRRDAAVRAAPVAPALVGKQLAQVPRRSVSASLATHLPLQIRLHGRVRALDDQQDPDAGLPALGEQAGDESADALAQLLVRDVGDAEQARGIGRAHV